MLKDGIFIAACESAGVESQSKKNRAGESVEIAQVVIINRILYQYNRDAKRWDDVRGAGDTLRAYWALETKEGNLRDYNIRLLRESLGWDGTDMAFFGTALPEVMIKVEKNSHNDFMGVQWMGPRNYDPTRVPGGPVVFDPQKASSIAQRLGDRLANHARTTSHKASPMAANLSPDLSVKEASAPHPVSRQAAAPPPLSGSPPVSNMTDDEAWSAFHALNSRTGLTETQVEEYWWETINDLLKCTGKDRGSITPEEWGAIAAVNVAHEQPLAQAAVDDCDGLENEGPTNA